MRSSLSLNVTLGIGFAVGGPRPRQLWACPPPKVRNPVGVFSDFLDERNDGIEPTADVNQCLSCGTIMGMLVVITATKVSLTAQEPASCAPLTGSLAVKSVHEWIPHNVGGVAYCNNEDAAKGGADDDKQATAEKDN